MTQIGSLALRASRTFVITSATSVQNDSLGGKEWNGDRLAGSRSDETTQLFSTLSPSGLSNSAERFGMESSSREGVASGVVYFFLFFFLVAFNGRIGWRWLCE